MAQTLVQLIVRNLYERTADVRWWATDDAFCKCMAALDQPAIDHAIKRLELINRFYSVYMNLVLVDKQGNVVACSNARQYQRVMGASVGRTSWFNGAIATRSGDEYVVDDIFNDPLHEGLPVSVYATAVRRGGEVHGETLGVIGVFFDWPSQSKTIVCNEPTLTPDEWQRSCVLLLDNKNRVIASSDGSGMLQPFNLNTQGKTKGHYFEPDGTMVAFAKTIGYQEYNGLGWTGVIIQKPDQNS